MRQISLCLLLVSVLALAESASGQDPLELPGGSSVLERLEATERQIAELEIEKISAADLPNESNWIAEYDRGFLIRPTNQNRHPFELRINGRMQFRHTGFSRDVTSWTDNAGVTRPVTNENYFEIERGRLEFRGFFLDPNLQFFLNIDGDTDDSHTAIFQDFWVNYEFSRAFDLYFGKAFVPGSRDWLNGSTRTRFVARSMATSFFRPDRTIGIWADGEPVERLYYRVMVGNGFNTTDLTPSEIDTHFVYSGSMWFDLGDYGQGYSDLEWHCEPAAQIGHSFTTACQSGRDAAGLPLAEENFVRLSDGTRLTELGALAPSVTVDHFDIYLYTIDAAFKYRGFSANGEYFARWLEAIEGNGALPLNQLYDHGFYFEVGYFLLPESIEVNGRISQVFGAFGDSEEYSVGFNWFINSTHNCKISFDATKLNHCPVSASGENLRAGDDGLLFRTQLQAAF